MSVHASNGKTNMTVAGNINITTINPRFSWLINYLQKYIIILLIVLLWEVLPRIGFVDTFLLPPFSEVMIRWGQMFISGEMFLNFYVSILRVLAGFLIGIGIAIPLGVFMGWYKGFEETVDPLLQACRSSSAIAIYPLFLLIFGIGEQAKIAIISWGTIWPTLLSTITGVRQSDPLLIKSARSMGASGLTLLTKVIVPGAVPNIVTGIRLSAAHSLLVLVVAEMIGAHAGLGYSIFYFEEHYAIREMYAMLLTIAVLGLIVNYILKYIEKRLTAWKERQIAE
ncbi:ABC transporter permease [Sporomusa aerivorans]|uniref:ABC transporter permease n=1 Tax=Sporomusa aerivorans TaxID=204936 RepID=UPI00352B3F96